LADHPDFGASKAGVQDEVFSEIVRIKLTQSLGKYYFGLSFWFAYQLLNSKAHFGFERRGEPNCRETPASMPR
jgi:hypothetical protein